MKPDYDVSYYLIHTPACIRKVHSRKINLLTEKKMNSLIEKETKRSVYVFFCIYTMEKFITRKRKLSTNQSAFAVAESESTGKVSVSFVETESTRKGTGTLEKKKKHRLYCNSYLNFGFTWCGDEEQPVRRMSYLSYEIVK